MSKPHGRGQGPVFIEGGAFHFLCRATLSAFLLLALSGLTSSIAAQSRTWNEPRVLGLIQEARQVRQAVVQDSTLRTYSSEARGYVYPIIKVDIDYYRPLYYDDAMYIYTRPALLERVRLQFDYLITPQASEELVCSGLTRHCAVNSTGKPVEIDEITANLWKVFPK